MAQFGQIDGYGFYLNGEPFDANAKPSPAFMDGWRHAKALMTAMLKGEAATGLASLKEGPFGFF